MTTPIADALPLRPPFPLRPADPGPEPCPVCRLRCRCRRCCDAGWLRVPAQPWEPDRFAKAVRCPCLESAQGARAEEHRRRVSNLDALGALTFEAFDPTVPGVAEAYAAARAYGARPEGWLVLYGKMGTGKTHLAAAIANELVGRGLGVLFQVVPKLLDRFRATFEGGSDVGFEELFGAVESAPVLVLDDLGAESDTQWARDKLFQLVDHRYLRRLPLVVTTNRRTPGAFGGEAGERLASRLFDTGLSTAVAMLGADYRQRSARERLRVVGGTEAR